MNKPFDSSSRKMRIFVSVRHAGMLLLLIVILALGLVVAACDIPGINTNASCNGNQTTCNNSGNYGSP